MEKYDYISELAENTAFEIVQNQEEWKKYLTTAARLYKYPFREQLLIYAQRPDATACASIEIWNERMHCWVKKGAKGIALLDDADRGKKLKYVFDVADVYAAKQTGRYPQTWKLYPEHEASVLNHLKQIYGATDPQNSFEERVVEIVERISAEHADQLVGSLQHTIAGSPLADLDETSLDLHLKNTLSESVSFTILSACGIEVQKYSSKFEFSYIHEFDTMDTLSILGDAANELAKPVLLEISKTVRAYEKLRFQKKEIENASHPEYNTLKRESEANNQQTAERGNNDESELREKWRLHDSDVEGQRSTRRDSNEVRNDAGNLSQGESERNLFSYAPEGDIERTSVNDPEPGRRTDGDFDPADGKERWSNGTAQGTGSDDLGETNEQYKESGRGDRVERTDLHAVEDSTSSTPQETFTQLSLFPSVEEQLGTVVAAEAGTKYIQPTDFSLHQDALTEILRSGGGKRNSRRRIYAKYTAGYDADNMINFLKNEYGQTGKGFSFDGNPVSVWFNEQGMRAAYGMQAMENPVLSLGWKDIEKYIRSMVENGSYISASEAARVTEGERARVADQIYFFMRDGISESYPEIGLEWLGTYPENAKKLTELLSDHTGREQLQSILKAADLQLKSGEKVLQWKYVKRPEHLLSEIRDLDQEPLKFPLVDILNVKQEDFITQDEIDYALCEGSDFSGGKYRIYDYFIEGHDKKDTIEFLKKEYGIGGRTSALPGNDDSQADHDAKGIRLEKGSYGNPYAKVLLKWNIVEKRLRELIAEDKYLSVKEKEEYRAYKEEQLPTDSQITIETPESNESDVLMSDKTNAANFHITDDALGVGTPKEKFGKNIEAITLLKQLEIEHRYATPQEQEILSQYVGWGGLSDAFDERKSNWSTEYQVLRELLSSEEYSMARESTLNSHYTSPVIIRQMYHSLRKMGFVKGNVLEPSMGIGNFFGMLPDSMRESNLYGVELDDISGRIAKQLYPQADIQINGFEKTDYPNDFFDLAIGNVPFGQYKVFDRAYDKHNFLIHDYFFAKTLDKVRIGGIIAYITSKGTMDKANPDVRRYIAQRADLLGAVRLPNTAFRSNAGTEVTSDILFFQKRDRLVNQDPDWVYLQEDPNGITMNSYFVEHPEQIVGKMEMISGPYGMESACVPDNTVPFEEQLENALDHITGQIDTIDMMDDLPTEQIIPADPTVKNFSYAVLDQQVYYRENSVMKMVDASEKATERIVGMIAIRNCTQELIDMQLNESSDAAIKAKQSILNQMYDTFTQKYGFINSGPNKRAFSQDSSYFLLCSLEKFDDNGNFKGKADMFAKRTIKKAEVVTSVDTSSEALTISLSEKGKIDLPFMSKLVGKDTDTLVNELTGIIFKNPENDLWETADHYLSGNVREKLSIVRTLVESHPEYAPNVKALTQVQPKELDASEIEVRIGATWIDPKYINDFLRDVFLTPKNLLSNDIIGVQYSNVTGTWNIKGKNLDFGNVLVNMTYGTNRVNAYKLLEDALNLKDTRVYDTIDDKRVLNKKETMIGGQKQESIRESFRDWVFRDPQRRQELVTTYNERFNAIRPREYDGSHLKFPGMTPDIQLKPYQKNAVAHVLYGNNTLLAHCVGAGKTFEMVAAAMESKRLGLCQKSLFVVPNHLIEQWASDFLRLYPGANILAATKKDFEPDKRKKFCSRIATGEYDAVIIGHSQFEKIPLSQERQKATIEKQINDIEMAIKQARESNGEYFSVKQMERSKKTLQVRLDKLNDPNRKDDVVTFEQLGIDRLFVDESHNYKNLFLYTKMRNVAGISQSEAKKSSDMFAKCQYLDEITGSKGVIFATGTPISNSMTELYTNMRYLQYDTLQKLGLGHFDSWASSFGETQTVVELAPEGTGYRAKTRFSKFFNLPELISIFKECADIQTADMLKLPVPEVEYETVVLKPSDFQKEIVASLADRAEAVRDRRVEPYEDNMLKITNDGRKLALDQRLINDMLPDNPNSKTSICVKKAYDIWEQTKEMRSTQLIFCDLSTPKGDGSFSVYEDIKNKLVQKGVPESEIAFIQDANTDLRKVELFAKVRSGQVRFLLGSTAKMGAGTNVQDRLIALHHIDVPWRPSDIEQQEGRILRQGNQNEKVKIFRYVTEGTFDSYSWQLIENKQKFIGQIMTSKSPVRSCDDIDEAALSYAEVKALATGNPHIKEKMDLDIQVSRLKLMKANHLSQKYRLEDNITRIYPQQIEFLEEFIQAFQRDIEQYNKNLATNKQHFYMNVNGQMYSEKKDAGLAIIDMCKRLNGINSTADIGEYLGFKLKLTFDSFNNRFLLNLKGCISHRMEIGADPLGTITRINHLLTAMPGKLQEAHTKLENINVQLETAKIEVTKEFPQEAELAQKQKRLAELNALLNMDQKESDTLALEVDETEDSALNHAASKNDAKEADLAIISAEYSHKKAVKKKPKLL